MRVVAATGMLGYGYEADSMRAAAESEIDLVGCDGGSTDGGPYYLGSGKASCSRAAVKSDLAGMLELARITGAPCVVGSCGTAGTDVQVEWVWEIVRELLHELKFEAKVALIYSEVSNEVLARAVSEGRLRPLDGVSQLTTEGVSGIERTVAMMGIEPINAALEAGADIVLAGRCSDAAVFAALPIRKGVNPAVAWCAGKFLECGAMCAEPRGPDAVSVTYDNESFTIIPLSEDRTCTPETLTEMMLHENANPFLHREPNGTLDLSDIIFTQEGRSVRVAGASFLPTEDYSVRLEGVRRIGHRAVIVAATRDPRLVASIGSYLAEAEERGYVMVSAMGIGREDYAIHRRVYGLNGVLGQLEFEKPTTHEMALIFEVVARTSEIAQAVASAFRSLILHMDFPERQCTEGNFALPFSPSGLDGGEVFEFAVWHALRLDDPLAAFPIAYNTVSP